MARKAQPRWRSRYPATWDGFKAWRTDTQAPIADTSEAKYKPIVLRAEELRKELFEDVEWGDIDPQDIAYDLMPTLYGEVKGRGGGEPASNTLRGRYDALDAYFTYLQKTSWMEKNPLELIPRPSSKAKDQPFLTPEEDEKLHHLTKEGHEVAIWALARGAGLREGELCDLNDEDVNLEEMQIKVRDGKTPDAVRVIPILPGAAVDLARYRRWRDEDLKCRNETTRFIRTSSGTISKGYVWKLVKAMAKRAEVGIVVDEETNEPLRTRDGEVVTRITPHALRRTFGSALVEAGIDPVYIFPIMGHSSEKVFHESYCKITDAKRFEKILAAVGDAPYALPDGLDHLERELLATQTQCAFDPNDALRRLAVLRSAADALEKSLRTRQHTGSTAQTRAA